MKNMQKKNLIISLDVIGDSNLFLYIILIRN